MRAPLIIAGVEISLAAMLDFSQQMQAISGRKTRRFADGSVFIFKRWRKMQVSLSGGGWIPPALWSVDYDAPFPVELPIPIVLAAGAPLPAGFTARAAPYGEVTNTDEAGAAARRVWVKFTAVSDGPSMTNDQDNNPVWQLVLEQA